MEILILKYVSAVPEWGLLPEGCVYGIFIDR